MKKTLFYILSVMLLFSMFSCNDDENIDTVDKETLAINEWITENMELYYFWNNQMPTIDYEKESDPIAYFKKLLNDDDRWSWITDDYASLAAEFEGTPVTMGYDPSFYPYGSGKEVLMVVNYVYPESAASKAGLERGDIILSINNTMMDTSNYYDLYSGSSYSVQLGSLSNNTLSLTGESINLTAEVTTTDPAIYNNVFEVNGKKIGYLVYVEFVAGTNDGFLTELDNIFDNFKSEGISDLIIDLRYNPGGEIDASTYLASEIAPTSVVTGEKVMVNMEYNTELQAFLEDNKNDYPGYLSYTFSNNSSNINMSRVYFLTGSRTASASELLITGLEPYMEVIKIGESTHGKYTGAWVLPDDNEEWAMIPIVMKYANINGYTDFINGLSPNYNIKDEVIDAPAFGDFSDPLMAKAINLIAGTNYSTTSTELKSQHSLEKIEPREMEKRQNLFVPINRKPIK
jgi:carboxyl-terminal processing protease